MPYLLETAEGHYVCDVSMSVDSPKTVETSPSAAHVARTLDAAISLADVVGKRGVDVSLVGVGKESLPIPWKGLDKWPSYLRDELAAEFDKVLR